MCNSDVTVGEAVGTGVVLDLLLFIFSGMVLCDDLTLPTVFAAGGHWVGNTIILARRAQKPTAFDIEFLRFGMLILCIPFLLLLWCRVLFT